MDVQATSQFLEQVRILISKGDYLFITRKKNMDTIAIIGITIPQAMEEIKTLSYREYLSGPKKDHSGDGTDIWEFGKEINGEDVYVKIKIDSRGCVCLSFHLAEKPF